MTQTQNRDHGIDFPVDAPDNRRQATRSLTDRGHCFSLEHANGTIIGALLDYSSKGLGLETFEPLDIGHSVVLKGNVDVNGAWKKVRGEAQVAYCEPSGDGSFRLAACGGSPTLKQESINLFYGNGTAQATRAAE
ncbi:MAG: PilZ domain-containing protein, partial [Acidobacteria bacterium]|nr:PilZ domain-containing protein [Acidobacteriota bacterium]